jgi:hypothetical protein
MKTNWKIIIIYRQSLAAYRQRESPGDFCLNFRSRPLPLLRAVVTTLASYICCKML